MKFEMKSFRSEEMPETEALHRRGQFKNEQRPATNITVAPRLTMSANPKVDKNTSATGTINEIGRSVSAVSGDSVLPVRTRLRRQRRMVNFEDQAEDPIERLNRLRARISGALSEVKGVLKQYSTESEAEARSADASKSAFVAKESESFNQEPKEPVNMREPVHFRFVKRVRRRSVFSDDNEDTEEPKAVDGKAKDQNTNENADKRTKDENQMQTKIAEEKKEIIKEESADEIKFREKKCEPVITKGEEGLTSQRESPKGSQFRSQGKEEENGNIFSGEKNLMEVRQPVKEAIGRVSVVDLVKVEEKTQNEKGQEEKEISQVTKNLNDQNTCGSQLIKAETTKEESSLKVFPAEIKTKMAERNAVNLNGEDRKETPTIGKARHHPSDQNKKEKFEKNVKSVRTEADLKECTKSYEIKQPTFFKPKNNLSVNSIPSRRSSIAAVEGSKIQPTLTPTTTTIQSQRRPSDSEAIVKRKNFIIKNTASNETALKNKSIQKVKRPPMKRQENGIITAAPKLSNVPEVKSNEQRNDKSTRTNLSVKDSTTTAKTTTLALPTVIDEPSLSATDIKATNDSIDITKKLANETISAVDDPILSSSLEAGEMNNQSICSAATEQLVKLLEEPLINRSAENSTRKFRGNDLRPSDVNQAHVNSNRVRENINVERLKTSKKVKDEQVEAFEGSESCNVSETHNGIGEIVANDQLQKQINFKKELQVRDVIVSQSKIQVQNLSNSLTNAMTPIKTNTTSTISDDHLLGREVTKATVSAPAGASPEKTTIGVTSDTTMPELPVKAVQVFEEPNVPDPFNVPKENLDKKKSFVRKLVRRSSNDKQEAKQKCNTSATSEMAEKAIKDRSKNDAAFEIINSENKIQSPPPLQNNSNHLVETADEVQPTEASNDETTENRADLIETTQPEIEKKKRLLKRKVIIKRQQRKLSTSDNFFKTSADTELGPFDGDTVEKPVEYIKVDPEEEQDYEEIVRPGKPTRSCLRVREYQVGDLVMYGERYKKTQVRWKKGIVLDRITSISYKLEVDGNEISAHISYIKKYSERKVNFSGKEYLDIEYEQVVPDEESDEGEEEDQDDENKKKDKGKKVRSYSIWNMV